MLRIAVQPPAQVQKGAVLWPPLVISCDALQYSFFQLSLVDSQGNLATPYLRGRASGNPTPLYRLGDMHSTEYAVFPDLNIIATGTYTICVQAYTINYEDQPPSCTCTEVLGSRLVQVRSVSVAAERASAAERQILEELRQNGIYVP